jgi:hypothetical protein
MLYDLVADIFSMATPSAELESNTAEGEAEPTQPESNGADGEVEQVGHMPRMEVALMRQLF